MKEIVFYTNLVKEGWSAKSLETGIGGSEEKLIELARELAKDYDVTVYHNGEHGEFDGVNYKDHREFEPYKPIDVFVSFKTKHMLDMSINARKKVHWTTDIESWTDRELDNVDRVVTISQYHDSMMQVKKTNKTTYDYLWVDTDYLDDVFKGLYDEKATKENQVLYSSSFDRGLEDLLTRWDVVKHNLSTDKLVITYGWDFISKIPGRSDWKRKMKELLDREDIEMVGRVPRKEMARLYWESKFWAQPCNNPRGELFCLSAVKAQYCGCIPLVRRVGGLKETVGKHYIDFDVLTSGQYEEDWDKDMIESNKRHVEKFKMKPAIKRWKTKILELK